MCTALLHLSLDSDLARPEHLRSRLVRGDKNSRRPRFADVGAHHIHGEGGAEMGNEDKVRNKVRTNPAVMRTAAPSSPTESHTLGGRSSTKRALSA